MSPCMQTVTNGQLNSSTAVVQCATHTQSPFYNYFLSNHRKVCSSLYFLQKDSINKNISLLLTIDHALQSKGSRRSDPRVVRFEEPLLYWKRFELIVYYV